jgi:hypothetical protein
MRATGPSNIFLHESSWNDCSKKSDKFGYGVEIYRSLLNLPLIPQRGSRGIAPLILNFVSRGDGCSTPFRVRFSRWRQPQYPINRRLVGPQSQSGRCAAEKSLLPLPGLERRTVQPVSSCYTDWAIAAAGYGFLSRYKLRWAYIIRIIVIILIVIIIITIINLVGPCRKSMLLFILWWSDRRLCGHQLPRLIGQLWNASFVSLSQCFRSQVFTECHGSAELCEKWWNTHTH